MNAERLCRAAGTFVLCLALAAGASAQQSVDRRVPLTKLLDGANHLSPNVRKHLSPGLQRYLRFAATVASNATSSNGAQNQPFSISTATASPLAASGPGGTIQVSNPVLDPQSQGFTQRTTSSAWCGNSVVVGYEDTGAFFRTNPQNQFGIPLSLDGISISSDAGNHFTDLQFLTPGTFSANALLGDPVVTCSSATHFQYASILNTTTPDGLDPLIGPSVSFSTNAGRTWSTPLQVVSLDGNTELADKPWMAVDPTNTRRMYLTYTHISFLGCVNIELVSSSDAGKTWDAPVVVDSDCDGGMVTGSNVVVSPSGKVYVAYESFPVPPAGENFTNNAIYFTRSVTDGKSFTKPLKISDVVPGGDGIELNGHVFVDEYPQLAVDRTNTASRGAIYVTWPDGRDKIVPDASSPTGTYAYPDIFVAKSTTFGASFKVLGAVSRTPKDFRGVGRDQFLPGIAVDNDGEVAVCYYDRRNDIHNLRVDRYCSVSANQGKTWTDLRASSLNWMPMDDTDPLDPDGRGIGEYDAVTSDFLLHTDGFFAAFEVEIGGNPNIVAKKF